MLKIHCLITIVTIIFSYNNAAPSRKSSLEVIFTKAVGFHNPKYFSLFRFTIKPSVPGPILDVDINSIHNFTVEENPTSYFNILRKEANGNYNSLFKITFNFCELAGSKDQSGYGLNVVKLWLDVTQKYSNLPKCPLMAGDHSVKNLRADKKTLPDFLFVGHYRLDSENYLKINERKIVLRNMSISMLVRRRK